MSNDGKPSDQKATKIPIFTKSQFLQSRQRPGYEKDILAAVLENGKSYTIVKAEKAIQNYLKKGVK
ncbi:hypothetical protein D3C74_182930 [compost metagenome]